MSLSLMTSGPFQRLNLLLQIVQVPHRQLTGGLVGQDSIPGKGLYCAEADIISCRALRSALVPLQVKPMGSHNSSFATKRGLQTPREEQSLGGSRAQ